MLSALLPLSGSAQFAGGETIAGALPLAVERVNADPQLLPGYTLDYRYKDSGCSASAALQALGSMANGRTDAVIGPACSVVS